MSLTSHRLLSQYTMIVDEPELYEFDWEANWRYYQRYKEAKAAGLTMVERRLFAESNSDIGVLRKLVKDGCPPELISRIVL